MYLENTRKTGLLKIGIQLSNRYYKPSNRHVIQQSAHRLSLPPPRGGRSLTAASSQISNFNLQMGILITGCMACGGGRRIHIIWGNMTLETTVYLKYKYNFTLCSNLKK